jgi:hypothetical protein
MGTGRISKLVSVFKKGRKTNNDKAMLVLKLENNVHVWLFLT